MARLHQLLEKCLHDRKITEDEVRIVEQYVKDDGKLDMDDVKFLVQLLSEADEVCPAFDELFFPVLKDVVLKDGRIDQNETFYLLKMLYSDGVIRENELNFLRQLRDEAKDVPAEFDEMLDIAAAAPARNWE